MAKLSESIQGKLSEKTTGGGGGGITTKTIRVPADFPTVTEANSDLNVRYVMGAVVTDNDPSKTNTGQTFSEGEVAVWDGVSAYIVIDQTFLEDNDTYLSSIGDRGYDLKNKALVNASNVRYDTGYSPTESEPVGTTYYDAENGTLSTVLENGVVLQHGQEIIPNFKNQTGALISNGTPVMFAGGVGAGGRIKIQNAIADGSIPANYYIGVATQNIPDGDDGKVAMVGAVRGIKTDYTGTGDWGTTWVAGQELFVSSTVAGVLTNVKPASPFYAISVGVVQVIHTNEGQIGVRAQSYPKMTDLPDVFITSYQNIYAPLRVNASKTGVEEALTQITEIDANTFQVKRIGGIGNLIVSASCVLDQDVSTTSAVNHASLSLTGALSALSVGATSGSFTNLGATDTTTSSLLVSGLTPSRLASSDGTNQLVSVLTLSSWFTSVGGTVIITDNAGGTVNLESIGGAGSTPEVDEFVATIGQTSFPLSQTPAHPTKGILFWNGQEVKYTDSYIISGTTLTWVGPTLPAGAELNYYYAYDQGQATPEVDEFVATIGQTSFPLSQTPAHPTKGILFWNGQEVKYTDSYTISGTTLTWVGHTLPAGAELNYYYAYDQGPATEKHNIQYATDPSSTFQSMFRVRPISGSGSHACNIRIPDDFEEWGTTGHCYISGYPASGAAGSGKDIDLSANYGGDDEPYNQTSESDTGTVRDFTGKTNQLIKVLDFKIVMNNVEAGDNVGIQIDHNGIGGTINYDPKVELIYNT